MLDNVYVYARNNPENILSSCELKRLCVIGLAPAHLAFKDEGGVTAVDFNVGKSDRSGIKVTGKRKKVNFCYLIEIVIGPFCSLLAHFCEP